jgi:hypothetical protein
MARDSPASKIFVLEYNRFGMRVVIRKFELWQSPGIKGANFGVPPQRVTGSQQLGSWCEKFYQALDIAGINPLEVGHDKVNDIISGL